MTAMKTPPAFHRALGLSLLLGVGVLGCSSSDSTKSAGDPPDAASDAPDPDAGQVSDAQASDDANGADTGDACTPYQTQTAACTAASCPEFTVSGDLIAATPTFQGFADPSLIADPAVPGRVWLAYSHLEAKPIAKPGGGTANVATVSTHLAVSNDQGKSVSYVGNLWPAVVMADPEGSGVKGYMSSETASITVGEENGKLTWYGVHLRYFMDPVDGYHPRYATGWLVRVGAAEAETPASLATAQEASLGNTTTADAYAVDVRLNSLAPELATCGLWNNPSLIYDAGKLYLIVDCYVFDGANVNRKESKTAVFSTTPQGPAPNWIWKHLGVIADKTLSSALGVEQLVSPDVARAKDGSLLISFGAPIVGESAPVGPAVFVLGLESLDPPKIRQNCDGSPLIRATITDPVLYVGAPSYDPNSGGLLVAGHTQSLGKFTATLQATGIHP